MIRGRSRSYRNYQESWMQENKMEQTFKDIYNRYYAEVQNVVRRYEHNRASQEDLIQEVFLKVWSNIQEFREESKLKTWIITIAKNVGIDHQRAQQVRVPSEGMDPEESEAAYEALQLRDIDSPEEIAIAQQTSTTMVDELVLMPTGLKRAFRLHHLGYTYDEIAEKLNCSNEVARQRVSRAKQRLQEATHDNG